jgi:hypothetical protein
MSIVNRMKSKFRIGQRKYVKGKRYKFSPTSRWQRDYSTGKGGYESREGFIHRDAGATDAMRRAGGMEKVGLFQKLSAVKTFKGKTKSELREEYMFSRGRLTQVERLLKVSATGYAIAATMKRIRSSNPFIRLMKEKDIKQSKAWADFHVKVGKVFGKAEAKLRTSRLPGFMTRSAEAMSTKVHKKTAKTFKQRQRTFHKTRSLLRKAYKKEKLRKGFAKGVRTKTYTAKALKYFKARRAYYPVRNIRGISKTFARYASTWKPRALIATATILRNNPTYAVGGALALGIGAIKLTKYIKARRFEHAVGSRVYEYRMRER